MNALMLRRGMILLAMVTLTILMWSSLKAGLANLYYFPAAYALEKWQNSTAKPDSEELTAAQQHISSAVHWQPQNPHYQLTAAKIAEWAWYSGQLSTELVSKNEQIYQDAIAQRPHWPVAYADYAYFLATVQLRLSDAWEQLQLAERYGQFLPEVHEKFLQVAFSNWKALDVEKKAEAFARVAAAMGGPLQHNTIRLIKQYQLERQQCIYLRKKLAGSERWPDVQRRLCPAS